MTMQERAKEIRLKDVFTKYRTIEFFKKYKSGDYSERFFSIKFNKTKVPNIYGYLTINNFIKETQKELISERIENLSIEIIEWKESFLVCFKDGVHISSAYRKVKKNEVFELFGIKLK